MHSALEIIKIHITIHQISRQSFKAITLCPSRFPKAAGPIFSSNPTWDQYFSETHKKLRMGKKRGVESDTVIPGDHCCHGPINTYTYIPFRKHWNGDGISLRLFLFQVFFESFSIKKKWLLEASLDALFIYAAERKPPPLCGEKHTKAVLGEIY